MVDYMEEGVEDQAQGHPKQQPKDQPKEDVDLEQVPAGLKHNIGFLLNRSARVLRDEMGRALEPLLLTVHQYAIMRIIELRQAETQQGVAERYGIDSSTMVEIVDRLEERQILTREKNPLDRRCYTLVLTPKGRKTLSRAKRIAEAEHKKFLRPLDEVEREMLYVSLAKLISSRESTGLS
jgi:DNA-binding MarR family transcriptional regulator